MRQTAADGPAIPDGEMCHVGHGAGKNWQMPGDHRRGFELKMARQGADTDVLSRVFNEGQVADPVDIDKNRRSEKAEIEHRDEALPASNDLRVAAAISQRRDRHVDA